MSDAMPTVDAPSKPRRFRRTRIAVSVFFGLLTVTLCVLWVRSRHVRDAYIGFGKNGTRTTIVTDRGSVMLTRLSNMQPGVNGWKYRTSQPSPVPVKYGWQLMQDSKWVVAPIWPLCLLSVATAFATAPWYPSRFSLRTMLIATTLVAVVLGLAVWVAR